MSLQVSVVVPTFQRPQLLNRCLQALVDQDIPPDDYEIIVVDDASDPQTCALVNAWRAHTQAAPYPIPQPAAGARSLSYPAGIRPVDSAINAAGPCIRYIATPGQRGPAAARNLGWRAARAPVVAFTDDDCIPQVDWLRRGFEAFSNPLVVGVSGRVSVPLPANPTDYQLDFACLERSEFVTANCFYLHSILEEEDGFDERFTTAWREDSDLYFRILKRGGLLVSAPQAGVVHPPRPVPWGISLHQQHRSMFNALLYKKHPHLYRGKLQPVPPFHYYGSVAALVALVYSVPASNQVLTLFSASLWLVITLLFFARRVLPARRTWSHILEILITSVLIPPISVYWRLRGAVKYRVLFI